jgi:tetratricopeptide (TPR) repeat protein
MAGEDIERLRQAALRDPGQLVRLADALVASERADEAVNTCRRALLSRPDDIPLRLALGRALSAAGQLEEAQAALLDAVSRQQKARTSDVRPASPPPRPATTAPPPPPPTPLSMLQPVSDREPSFETGDGTPTGVMDRPPSLIEDRGGNGRGKRESSGSVGAARRTPFRRDETPLPPHDYVPPPREFSPPREEYVPPRGNGAGGVDLVGVAERLLGAPDDGADVARWEAVDAPVVPDAMTQAWDARRARAFIGLWVLMVLTAGGLIGGWIYRSRESQRMLAATVERADARTLEATAESDWAARDGYATALRAEPRLRKYFAMVAFADARLAADQGEDSDAAGWAMLKRAEREEKRHPGVDPRAERDQRQGRALLALARGEPCTATNPAEDGDIAARCSLQKGDVAAARKILSDTIVGQGEAKSIRSLLTLGSLELGAGDLDAAQVAYGKVLMLYPQHPRALVGRLLVSLERNEAPAVTLPPGRLGPTTEAWFHLAAGLSALGRAAPEAQVSYELDLTRTGIVHDGRLALLYGRARLLQGQVGEAEQAMRVAERLDPNDGDVAVLDAEVALAKGFEDKVSSALAARPATPRSLAVLGRAQALTGRYKEAAATLDAALARRPGDAVAITYRAIARAHLGDAAGAVRELERAATTLKSTAPRYGLGLLAYERHDLSRARSELGKALEHNSESFRARALLGRVLRDLGKPKEALAELDRVMREAPALMTAHAARARLYLDLGRVREARTDARAVMDSGRAGAEDKLVFAEATIRLGHPDEGERALKDATDAGVPAVRAARLKLLLQSWRGPKEALVAAKTLEKERKGPAERDAALAIDAADAWRRAGDLHKAAEDLRAALDGDPLRANLQLGRVQLASGARDEAEVSFRAALAAWDKGPFAIDDQTDARIGLGRTLTQRDPKNKEAVTLLEAAVKDDAGAAEPHFWLARAYADAGDPGRARAQIDKAVELDDSFAEALALAGDLWRPVDKERARKAYKKYLEVNPSGDQAKLVKRALTQLK